LFAFQLSRRDAASAPSYRNGYATSSADGRRDRRIDAISEENRVFLHWRSMPALNGGDP
jgi:hypothetical protein